MRGPTERGRANPEGTEMCQLTAYMGEGEQQQKLLEDIAVVKVDGDRVQLSSLFGESKEVEGRIRLLKSNTLYMDPVHTHAPEPAHDDAQKLAILLDHWVEHNLEHNRELERWAGKASSLGKQQAYDEMQAAAACIEEANQHLQRAAASLGAASRTPTS